MKIQPTNGNLLISMSKKTGAGVTKGGIVLIKVEESYGEEATIEAVSEGETQFNKGEVIFVKDYQVVWLTDVKEKDTDYGFIESKVVLGKK